MSSSKKCFNNVRNNVNTETWLLTKMLQNYCNQMQESAAVFLRNEPLRGH